MMVPFFSLITSSVGKKIMTGITGLSLCLFVLAHLAGNLNLFVGPEAFNSYTYKLESFGGLLYVLEALLAVCFLLHALVGISIYLKKRSARPVRYDVVGDAGGVSKKSVSSTTMIWTGLIILVFLFLHISAFKFGSTSPVMVNGVEMRDLYALVIAKFKTPLYAFGYTLVMVLLGFHLRHGFWSAFQSLGVNHPRLKPVIFTTGIFFSLIIAAGFVALPLWVFFTK